MIGFDIYYLILVVPTLILSMIAQFMVKSAFAKYSKIPSKNGITGLKAADILLNANSIKDVGIEAVKGSLTDHYDPTHKKLRLSEPVYSQTSIAAIGVSAHETGHAIQHATRWGPLVLRSTLVPVANIGSRFGPWVAMAGFFLQFGILIYIGIFLFTGAVLFYIITLPVEFNASNRAIAILRDNKVLDTDELKGARKVLNAAAMTYVASALTAFASLLRLILLARRRR